MSVEERLTTEKGRSHLAGRTDDATRSRALAGQPVRPRIGQVAQLKHRLAAPVVVPDFGQHYSTRGAPIRRTTAPYFMAHPEPVRMAHEVRPLPANRSRIAPDLLAIAVILAVELAALVTGVATLAGVRL